MRSKRKWLLVLLLLAILGRPATAANANKRLVILAIDDSGSMQQNDPQKLRAEAALMMATIAADADIVGISAFGSKARWLFEPTPMERSKQAQIAASLENLRSNDGLTKFADPLHEIVQYLSGVPAETRSAYDISIVVFTDGRSDAGSVAGTAADRAGAIEAAHELHELGARIHTIGLGHDVDVGFLSKLAESAEGYYSPAESGDDLVEAFLKVGARTYQIPAYIRASASKLSGPVHLGDQVQRVYFFLFRASGDARLQISGEELLNSPHIQVIRIDSPPADINVNVANANGKSTVIVCEKQPIHFELANPLPAVALMGSNIPIDLKVIGGREQLWSALFLQSATVRVRLSHEDTGNLYRDNNTKYFSGAIAPNSSGQFDAKVLLSSPFGKVDGFLGKITISDTAAVIQSQLSLEVPARIPMRLIGVNLPIRYALPAGIARIHFFQNDFVAVTPEHVSVSPGGSSQVRITPRSRAFVTAIQYEVEWTDGARTENRRAILTVQATEISLFAFVQKHWFISCLVVFGLLFIVCVLYRRRPMPLKGRLVIQYRGVKEIDLDLPRDLRTRELRIAETTGATRTTRRGIHVGTGAERELITLRNKRVRRRWQVFVSAETDAVATEKGPVRSETRLDSGEQMRAIDKDIKITLY
jgi:Mg-chelatase subunit ChlD